MAFVLLFVFASFIQADQAKKHYPNQGLQIYEKRKSSRFGTGKFYLGREIAQVMGHLGAAWLDRPERQREERPDLLIETMDLKQSDWVADIGAGTGYFSIRISPHVSKGKVFAVDIQPEMLAILTKKIKNEKLDNVTTILGDITQPNLPVNTIDVVLLVDTYHEFSHPFEMMKSIYNALKKNGRLILVEYRGENPEIPILELHKMTVAQAKKEMNFIGFHWVITHNVLPQQHIMVFKK